MIAKMELQLVLRALHRVAMDTPTKGGPIETRDNAYGPRLWHEGIALWESVLAITELSEDDPQFSTTWVTLVNQARKYLGESATERHGFSSN